MNQQKKLFFQEFLKQAILNKKTIDSCISYFFFPVSIFQEPLKELTWTLHG